MIGEWMDHLPNDFEHIITLKGDYLGVVYVWPLGVSLGVEQIDTRFTRPLTQRFLENSYTELPWSCLEVIYVWFIDVLLGLKHSDKYIIAPFAKWFPAFCWTETKLF